MGSVADVADVDIFRPAPSSFGSGNVMLVVVDADVAVDAAEETLSARLRKPAVGVTLVFIRRFAGRRWSREDPGREEDAAVDGMLDAMESGTDVPRVMESASDGLEVSEGLWP